MNYRHGDMLLVRVDKLPEGLKVSNTTVLMSGSGGNPHSFTGGKFYPVSGDQFIIGYLVADQGCKLFHKEHGDEEVKPGLKEAEIEAGIYQVRQQVEDTHSGMRKVVD